MKAGSVCSGYGGLDMAASELLGTESAWFADTDPAASKVLAHHWPDVPNLGDISAVDWSTVEPVDVLTGGTPCQDVSAAGKRAGMGRGTRSGLWHAMCEAIEVLRPGLVLWENVRGALSARSDSAVEQCPGCLGGGDERPVLRALGRVLGDLADCGYDAVWCGLPAAAVGCAHLRWRVFVAASPRADTTEVGRGTEGRDDGFRSSGLEPVLAADPGRIPGNQGGEPLGVSAGCGGAAATAHAASNGRGQGWPEPAGQQGGPDAAERGVVSPAYTGCPGLEGPEPAGGHELLAGRAAADADINECSGQWIQRSGGTLAAGRGVGVDVDWREYGPAIRQHERMIGRPAPAPTVVGQRGGPKLSPYFTEWLMGLPEGHITGVPGLSVNDQLRLCGNGVVPAQAVAAYRYLLPILFNDSASKGAA